MSLGRGVAKRTKDFSAVSFSHPANLKETVVFFPFLVGKEAFFMKNKKHLFSLALTSVFVAITVVISRFLSINIWNMSIGFSFVSLMLCGILLGWGWGGVCGALADFIGAILFPFGPYFPGFTLTAFLSGAIFGVIGLIARKNYSRIKFIAVSSLLLIFKETVCSLLLNTYFILLLYGGEFLPIMLTRLPVSIVTLILEIALAIVSKEVIIKRFNREL